MNYIGAEEFLKQSGKVQKVLIDWWNINKNDFDVIVGTTNKGSKCNENRYTNVYTRYGTRFDDIIPLMSEAQLRKFIEEKKGKLIKIEWFSGNGYRLIFQSCSMQTNEHNLLQGYWQMVCKISEETLI